MNKHPYPVPNLRTKVFSLLPLNTVLLVGFYILLFTFYQVEEVSISNLLWIFITNGTRFCKMFFLCQVLGYIWFFFFSWLHWLAMADYIDYFNKFWVNTESVLYKYDKSHLVIFFICCWILSANIVRIFVSKFMKDSSLQFSLYCTVFLWLIYQCYKGLIKWINNCFLSLHFWKSLCKSSINSLNVPQNSPV